MYVDMRGEASKFHTAIPGSAGSGSGVGELLITCQ